VTDQMFMSAACALANLVSEADLRQGSLYPALSRIREVSTHIAAEVATVAFKNGLTNRPAPRDMLAFIQSKMYEPRYDSPCKVPSAAL
jgi:malate dehydrogenase (oxaloacetate-decarboxylating)(NADP+)